MAWRGLDQRRDRVGAVRPFCRALIAAAFAQALQAAPADAQPVPDPGMGAELDPSAPLDPLADIGVDWPSLDPAEPVVEPDPAVADAPETSGELRYSYLIEGLDKVGQAGEIEATFITQSVLHDGRTDPANAAQIERRSRVDSQLLAELLRAEGFYDATVTPRVESRQQSVLVVLAAEPGEQYRFASVELPGLDAAGEETAELRRSFAVQPGDPVIAEEVIAAGLSLKVALGERGFALAEVGEQQVEVDHQARTARLVLPVDPGAAARFGQIRVTGRPPFSASHLERIARFERGEPFRRSRVDDLRRALIATGLVASADVQVVPSADRRTVDLAVRLDPAPMRTIAGELGYGTGEGVRAELSWQHRNLFNPEGALTVRGVAGTEEQLAAVQLRRNNFRRRDQLLNIQASASHTDRDAFEARTILLGIGIERQSNIIWRKKWTWSVGADFIATDERGVFSNPQAKETRTFLLTALPATLGYDGSDDLLNPTRGFRLSGRISPEFSAHGGSFFYTRAQLDGSVYRPISDSTVLAGRVRLGTILGASVGSIAPSRRIFSGGGGSVRGYGYQKLGPRDFAGDPLGGRGLAEFALEARYRLKLFGGNFGIVPFLDGGTLSTNAWPDLKDWQFGAGLGVRYYSTFGPIRVDVGTPLNPRSGDGRIAVTVSLGQAF